MRFLSLLLLATSLGAQTPAPPPPTEYPRTYLVPATLPKTFVAAGVAWNQYSTPQINGWASYGNLISASAGVYSFTSYDVTSVSRSPFRVQTSTRTGFAYYLKSAGRVDLFALGDIGVALAPSTGPGTNIGLAYSGGGMATVRLGRGWALVIPIRTFKSALSDKQTIFEIGFGYGQ